MTQRPSAPRATVTLSGVVCAPRQVDGGLPAGLGEGQLAGKDFHIVGTAAGSGGQEKGRHAHNGQDGDMALSPVPEGETITGSDTASHCARICR